jgi:hypothetical protein
MYYQYLFFVFKWHLSLSIYFIIFLSISSLALDTFFCYELCCIFTYSCSILLFILSDHCWSIACNECCDCIANYLEERRNELVSTTIILSRLIVRKPQNVTFFLLLFFRFTTLLTFFLSFSIAFFLVSCFYDTTSSRSMKKGKPMGVMYIIFFYVLNDVTDECEKIN